MLNEIAIMHRKSRFSKIKVSIFKVLIEAANKCNTLTRPAFSIGLVTVKLKRDLKYRVHVLRIRIAGFIFWTSLLTSSIKRLLFWNHTINSLKISLLQKVSQLRTCSGFLIYLWKFKRKIKVLLKKIVMDGKGIHDTENDTEYDSVEDDNTWTELHEIRRK